MIFFVQNCKFLCLLTLYSSTLLIAENNATELDVPKIVKVKEGVYTFGQITIDRKEEFLILPAISNQINGLVEYGIVHENGKIHESLFRTTVRPQNFHTSLLLLKAKPEKSFFDNLWSEKPELIDYSQNCFNIEVSWEVNGTRKKSMIEKLSINQNRKSPVLKKSFLFTGSRIVEGTFLAESTGSILAIYADDNAIINNSDFDSNNDDVWIANEKEMPPLETLVMISFHLPR